MALPFARAACHRSIERGHGWDFYLVVWPRRNPPICELSYRLTVHLWWTLPRFRWTYIREKC